MINISYCAFLNSTGYAQAAKDFIMALHESGEFNIKIEPLSPILKAGISDVKQQLFTELINKPECADSIKIYHCIPPIQAQRKKAKINIGFATFETYDPPKQWIDMLNKDQAVITPSRFNYEVFAHSGVKQPLLHIPHCIDMNVFNDHVEPLKKYDCFSFLFFGSWKKRKGYEALLEAWFSEFSKKDNVQLVIKTDKVATAQSQVEFLRKNLGFSTKDCAPILFENTIFDELILPRFMKSFDCLISPTLGEGFGLPGLQSMALGVPVIITDFSGCQDYANEETANLLKIDGFVHHKLMDNYNQFTNKKWAFVSVASIRQSMRDSVDKKQVAQDRAKNAIKYVVDRFSYSKCSNNFIEALRSLRYA